jgi:cell wall-associated NlpC family hydrolase
MVNVDYADLIGKPFTKAGRGPDGYDCYGVVREMFRRAGKEVPNYSTSAESESENAQILAGMQVWKKTEAKPGVAVVFRLLGKLHVGYLLPYGRMIHAWERSGGVTVERFDAWQKRAIGYYEY